MRMPSATSQATRVFISHSSKDNDFVRRLASDLCYVLGDENAVWFDVLGLQGGDAWWPKIVREINSRDIFILVMSPDAMRSPWVDDELQIAWRHKNDKTGTGKKIIPIYFRECKRMPDYLRNLQWVKFLPPATYQSAFNKLLEDLKIALDASTREFIRKLETLNPDFARPVIPKSSADFDKEELAETLNLLGKYTAYYIAQNRWDQVLLCVEEALPVATDKSPWLSVQQEALVKLGRKEGLTTNQGKTELNRPKRENYGATDTNYFPKKSSNAQKSPFATARGSLAQSSNQDAPQQKSNMNSSPLQFNALKATDVYPQPPNSAGTSPRIFKNFADFVPRLSHENNRLLLFLCIIDIIIIPIFIGVMLQSYFVLGFLVGLILSFLAFIVGPVTKSRKVAILSIVFFSLSWITLGLFLIWIINQFFNWMSVPYSKLPVVQLDYKFAIVFGALSLLCGFSVHLFVIVNTDYVEEKVIHKPSRKRSKR